MFCRNATKISVEGLFVVRVNNKSTRIQIQICPLAHHDTLICAHPVLYQWNNSSHLWNKTYPHDCKDSQSFLDLRPKNLDNRTSGNTKKNTGHCCCGQCITNSA